MSMQSLLSVSMSLQQMKVVQSTNEKTNGRINILKAEIKQDGGNEKKEEKVKELQEKSTEQMGTLMDNLKDVNESLKPGEEEDTTESGKETEGSKDTDRVELSEAAKSHGEKGAVSIVQGETTYQADGSEKPKAQNKGKALDISA